MALIFLAFFLFLQPAQASYNSYPKLANYYLKTPISNSEINKLAKWDVVILGMQVQDTNLNIFSELKNLNPNIKIIAYLSSMEFPIQNYKILESSNGPWHKMYAQINSSWWLKDKQNNIHSIWPGNYSFNVTNSEFNSWLPKFVKQELINTGNWDGVFFDNVLDKINNTNLTDNQWQEGMKKLLENTRKELGNNKIILINSSSYTKNFINGRIYESWPDKWQGSWVGQMNDYKNLNNSINYLPHIIILNPNTNNTGDKNNFKKVRFGLASSLLENGYFAFDFGTEDHSQLWWYDEYNINLGQPINSAQNLLTHLRQGYGGQDKFSVQYESGIWRRDFENGIALVNSTQQNQIINLDNNAVYEKIRGVQDKKINNGELVKQIFLPAQDGIILLKKLELINQENNQEEFNLINTTFINGSYLRIFDKRGNNKRSGFFAYLSKFEGGAQINISDLDQDGKFETIVANSNSVKIFNSQNNLVKTFYPYGEKYNSGINIAIGNIQDDKKLEIVTGTQQGGGPQIRIFNYQGNLIHTGWFAYNKNFRGGVNVALGDLNGNGYKEIVTGAGFGGGPHIRIFRSDGHLFDPGFFSYDLKFRGGVNVACLDLNNDGKDEIITGAGLTGGPHIRIYDKIGHLVDPGFFAFDPDSRNGAKVSAFDIDQDEEVEILAY